MAEYNPDEFFDRRPFVMCRDCVYPEIRAYGLYCTKGYAHISGIGGCRDGKGKSTTNADKIRAMSDEELAEFLMFVEHRFSEFDRRTWLDWLQQEVDDGDSD